MSGLEEQRKLYDKLQKTINNKGNVADLLKGASKDDLLKILTDTDIIEDVSSGKKCTVTPLGLAIILDRQQSIEAILDAAIGQGILQKVLTTANITVKLSDGMEYTVTPLGLAISFHNQKSIEAILDAAIGQGEVFAGIEKDDRGKIKTILKEAGNQDMLDKISQVEKDISDNRAAKGNSTSDESATTEQATNKAIMIGVVCGVIAGLAVGIGCGVANVGLSMLVIASIAVVAALAVGLAAYGIAYAISKPNTKVDKTKAIQVDENIQKVPS